METAIFHFMVFGVLRNHEEEGHEFFEDAKRSTNERTTKVSKI
jgi:hypothetical protein